MKVLHVITSLSPRAGGSTTVLKALARYQAQAGIEVTICTTNIDHPHGVIDVDTDIPVLKDGVTSWYFSAEFRPMAVSRSLRAWAKRSLGSFDLIHVHTLYRFPPTYCANLARKMRVPYIIQPHGALDPYLYNRSAASLPLKRLYENLFDFPNLHGAGAIHYTAEDERRLTSFLNLKSPSFILPNGIEWERFETLPERGRFRVAYALGNAPLVLFLGRLHHKKGLDLLIPAFAKVRQIIPEARMAIVGPANDHYADQVRIWVQDNGLVDAVTFVDFLTGSALIQAYVDADVFVLPSYTENFGMTVLEAMACGLPVVVSNRVNIHHEVSNESAGLVTDCNAEEVARSVVDLLKDPERCREMGAKGRFAAKDRYAWPGIVEALTGEYKKVIACAR